MKELIIEYVANFPVEVGIILLAALPITELRASIPFAIAMGVDPSKALFLSLIGNFLPILPILFLFEPVVNILKKVPIFDKIINGILNKTRSKSSQVDKYGVLGLTLFVGIPVPGTGVWTGCLLAYLFGIKKLKAIIAITAGMCLAGLIVLFATIGIFKFIKAVSIELVIGILVVIFFIIIIKKYTKTKRA